MLFSVEQAFVGRDEKGAPLKTPAREARKSANFAEIANITRIFYSAATTTTKHANKYRKNNRNALSKSSDL